MSKSQRDILLQYEKIISECRESIRVNRIILLTPLFPVHSYEDRCALNLYTASPLSRFGYVYDIRAAQVQRVEQQNEKAISIKDRILDTLKEWVAIGKKINKAALARLHNITRPTLYKYLGEFQTAGLMPA